MTGPSQLERSYRSQLEGGYRPQLERSYRRVLACYPGEFRRDSGEEMLAVLLAGARRGQRRAGLAELADLVVAAVRMHLGLSRSPRPVRNAVRLMCAGAVAELGVLVTVLVTLGGVRSAIVQYFTAAQWHTAVLTQLVPLAVGAPVLAGLWLWLAWANGRGYDWAQFAFAALFGLVTIELLLGLGGGAAVYAPADLIAMTVPWLAALPAVVLIFSKPARGYYQHQPLPPAGICPS